jgi:hypothetical protein
VEPVQVPIETALGVAEVAAERAAKALGEIERGVEEALLSEELVDDEPRLELRISPGVGQICARQKHVGLAVHLRIHEAVGRERRARIRAAKEDRGAGPEQRSDRIKVMVTTCKPQNRVREERVDLLAVGPEAEGARACADQALEVRERGGVVVAEVDDGRPERRREIEIG